MTVEYLPHNRADTETSLESLSNLSPELQAFVRSEEFKAWFGDWENDQEHSSKMVDENGEPRIFIQDYRLEFENYQVTKEIIPVMMK